MADRVVLHIGAPKTGTTFLQAVLFHNKDRLAEQGVLVPGKSRRAHGGAAGGLRQGPEGKRYADWQWLVRETRRWPGTVVVSNEWFSMASAKQAALAIEELGPDRTHVVFTARDFVDQVPGAWQETVKLGRARSLDEFFAGLDARRGRWRWSVLDAAEVLERWRGELSPDRLHVVTVPPRGSDPSLLWRRFAQTCGIDPDSCESEMNLAKESLSAESAALLQRLGPFVRSAIDADSSHWSETYRWIQRYLAEGLLVPRPGSRIAMRPEQVSVARERSWATVKAVVAAGYDVVGDIDDLTSGKPPQNACHPDDVSDSEMLAVALPLVGDLLSGVRSEAARAGGAAPGR